MPATNPVDNKTPENRRLRGADGLMHPETATQAFDYLAGTVLQLPTNIADPTYARICLPLLRANLIADGDANIDPKTFMKFMFTEMTEVITPLVLNALPTAWNPQNWAPSSFPEYRTKYRKIADILSSNNINGAADAPLAALGSIAAVAYPANGLSAFDAMVAAIDHAANATIVPALRAEMKAHIKYLQVTGLTALRQGVALFLGKTSVRWTCRNNR
jgi:hypothetical protein